MRAMILAAGLGTRLRPLTRIRPKVLAPVMGMPLLHYWIWRLHQAGFDGVVINAFHLPGQILDAVHDQQWPIPVAVRVESTLLGTAGGIRNALDFFGEEPFVVVNGDILCNADLLRLYTEHVESGSAVGLLLHDFPAFNNVAVHGDCVAGFGDEARRLSLQRPEAGLLAFTGIHVLNPGILAHLEAGRPHEIIPVYRDLISAGTPPRVHLQQGLEWREIGSIDAYRTVHAELSMLPEGAFPPLSSGSRVRVHPTAYISTGAVLHGTVVVGRNTQVLDGARLENVILWDDATVQRDCTLRNCIVTDGVEVAGYHENEILCTPRADRRDVA